MSTPSYDQSMTTRITVSLPDELVEQARVAVELGIAGSVSAYVAEALAEKRPRTSLKDVLDEWDKEFGPVDPEIQAWADRVLDELED